VQDMLALESVQSHGTCCTEMIRLVSRRGSDILVPSFANQSINSYWILKATVK